MKERVERELWVGLDWGDESHAVVALEAESEVVVKRFEVQHSAQGLDELVGALQGCGKVLGVAVESSRHMVVIKLLQSNFPVYPINPKVSKKWRQCEKPQESATDLSDAEVLGKNLCYRHKELRELRPDDEQTRTLAMLCSDESQLIAERTALVNKLIATLKMYYPQALRWFGDWTLRSAWDFILTFPTAEAFRVGTKKKVLGFLKGHRIGVTEKWRAVEEKERKAPNPWPVDGAVEEAKCFLAVRLCKQLRTLDDTLDEYRTRIEELYAQHPDHDIFSSLPGAGSKLAPRLLTIFGSDRDRFSDARGVQELSGTVPVTKKSGKRKDKGTVYFRRSCNKAYRNDLHLFSQGSKRFCAWAQAFYKGCREEGQDHNEAVRRLASKWLKIIFRMWQDREPYDEARYLNALIQHGSPTIRRMQQSFEA